MVVMVRGLVVLCGYVVSPSIELMIDGLTDCSESLCSSSSKPEDHSSILLGPHIIEAPEDGSAPQLLQQKFLPVVVPLVQRIHETVDDVPYGHAGSIGGVQDHLERPACILNPHPPPPWLSSNTNMIRGSQLDICMCCQVETLQSWGTQSVADEAVDMDVLCIEGYG